MKAFKFFEYAYLGICILSTVEVILLWNSPDRQRFYMFLLFGVASLGMFFFRRMYRKKFEQRNKQ